MILREATYWTQSYCRGCKADESAIPRMRLMDGICKIVAQLLNNFLDAIKFLRRGEIPDNTFEAIQHVSFGVEEVGGERGKDACVLECSDLPLVVELIIQRALDTWIHTDSDLLKWSWSDFGCCLYAFLVVELALYGSCFTVD